MYIKLSFAVSVWMVPNVGGGAIGELTSPPKIIPELPGYLTNFSDHLERGMYIPLRRGVGADQGNIFEHYIDCGDLPAEKVKQALEYIKHFYNDYRDGLPATVMGMTPQSNEIVVNIESALHNVRDHIEYRNSNSCADPAQLYAEMLL